MDLSYFESAIPVMGDILNIIIASGWALLLGNLVFQAAKSMMSGLGFEGEDPKTLFARTFVFGFLLLASRQVCDIGLGISSTVITLLQVPSSVSVDIPGETAFSIGASWLLVIIVGFVLMWQIVKLFFEIGERYFLVGFLTIMSPWAFAMGGSKSTADIFKGWARMFASMCVMMVMNVLFLKILLSAMGSMPSGAGVLPWLIFVVAIARVARKIDNIIARIGLNPVLTGEGLGRGGLPGMLSYMVIKSLASGVTKAAGGAAGKSKTPPKGSPNPSGNSSAGNRGGAFSRNNTGNRGTAGNTSNTQNSHNSSTSQQAGTGAAGTQPAGANPSAQSVNSGAAGTPPPASANTQVPSAGSGAAGKQPAGANSSVSYAAFGAAGNASNTTVNQGSPSAQPVGGVGRNTAKTDKSGLAAHACQNNSRSSSVTKASNARSSVFRSGTAGTPANASPIHPPIPRTGQANQSPATVVTQTGVNRTANGAVGENSTPRQARYSTVHPSTRNHSVRSGTSGAAGMANTVGNAWTQQSGGNVSAQHQTNISADLNSARHAFHSASNHGVSQPKSGAPSGAKSTVTPAPPGSAGMAGRRTSVPTDKTQGAAGGALPLANSLAGEMRRSPGAAGTETRRSPAFPASPTSRPAAETPRGGRNQAPPSPASQSTGGNPGPTQAVSWESGFHRNAGEQRITRQPSSDTNRTAHGAAGKQNAAKARQSAVGQGTARVGGIDNREVKRLKKYRKGKGGK